MSLKSVCVICARAARIYRFGYTGYACTDARGAQSKSAKRVEILLLVLSNIAFVPGVVLALYRRYFPEAAIYALTGVNSAVRSLSLFIFDLQIAYFSVCQNFHLKYCTMFLDNILMIETVYESKNE